MSSQIEIGGRLVGEDTPPMIIAEAGVNHDGSPEQARRQLVAAWGDPGFVDGALAYWATLIAAPEPVSDTVQKVTGIPARTFRQWAEDHREDFC